MIRGLEHFRQRFKDYSNDFILIGGVASYILLDEAGAERVRPTKDLDIVLIMRPSEGFLKTLKDYVKEGEYEIEKGDNDQATFYRFLKPIKEEFPIMLELFATADSSFELYDGQHIIPISTPSKVESLSAILLDNEYYDLIKKHAVEKNGINLLNPFALIPFKAKAYLEIKERKEDSKNWKKHRGDIINLAVTFLNEESEEKLTGKVKVHFQEFMEQFKKEINADIIKGACKQKLSSETIVFLLEKTFI
jgi:hypothetical protein